jgi:hypothetical protein
MAINPEHNPAKLRRRIAVSALGLGLLTAAACNIGSGESADAYYEAYLAAESEVLDLGERLDSTLIRIQDLENAIDEAHGVLAGAETSALESQMASGRDALAAQYHAGEAIRQVVAARSRLSAVR